MGEYVELATIMFTDLVGSTQLESSVGPVRADELRDEHFGVLRDAVASSGGREVKNTGDGMMVAFSSASAAVKCAVLMQQLLERRYRNAEQALHVRIGMSAGEATVKDGDYFGMPSIEAARLCDKAPSDGILASGLVKALAGRSDGVEFEAAGELELKGLPEAVQAFTVWWAPLAEEGDGAADIGSWPLPAVLRSVPPVRYVGRVDERAALEEAMKLSQAGERQLVLLSGEPGIGKTRLASFAAHGAHANGFGVFWGSCSEDLAVPYEPWIGVCTHVVENAPTELLTSHVRRHHGELRRVARNLAGRVADLPELQNSDPETERYLLFNAVAGLLGELAEIVPVCVVLDDLHWADAESLALLKHLLRSGGGGSLQLIATYRDSDLRKDHPLTALLPDLHRVPGVQRIGLEGLDIDDVGEIMAAVAGHELDHDGQALAREIAQETDGNPFFVGEILRGLTESGTLVFDKDSGRWAVDGSVEIVLPQSVREVVERRVERLGDEAFDALKLAAVIGRDFDLGLLAAAVGADEARLLDHLEAAVAASVLGESMEHVGSFRFAHALINQTLYDGLGATRRARMHLRVAVALEELYGTDPAEHLAELALHWRLAAVSIDKDKAAGYAVKAGQQALASLAPAEALKLFTDALDLIGDENSRERCEALIGLGEAQFLTGVAAFRATLLQASALASRLGDAELAAHAAVANSRGFPATGIVDEERLAAIECALELDDPPSPGRRARLLAVKASELTFDPDLDQRRTLVEEAISLARETSDVGMLTEVLRLADEPLRAPMVLDLRRQIVDELLRYAPQVGDPWLIAWAHNFDFGVAVEEGDFASAKAALDRKFSAGARLNNPKVLWGDLFIRAGWALTHGNLDDGEQFALRAFQQGQEAGESEAMQILGVQLAFLRRTQGRASELIEAVEQGVDAYPAIPSWRAGLPWMLCGVDRLSDARDLLERVASDGFERIARLPTATTAMALYADVAVETRSAEAAAAIQRVMEPWSDQFIFSWSCGYGHVRMWLGLLAGVTGDHGRAERELDFACEFYEANELPVWLARTHLGWAEDLAARGEPSRAREHAARALEISREHGYGLFESRATTLLAAGSIAET